MDTKLNKMTLIVNETFLKNNYLSVGNFRLNPKVQRRIGKSTTSDNSYIVEVRVEIRNTAENPFPVDLIADISGVFNIDGDDAEQIDAFLKTQGFQMVFPHLRSLVANMMTCAMMPPIFLPIVYADQFDDNKTAE